MAEKKLPKGVTLRKDGRYMGRFMYHGQAFTVYGEDPRKVKKELDNLRYEVEHNMYNKPSKITTDRWFDEWIEVYKGRNIKPATVSLYERVYRGYLKEAIGKKYIADIRANDLQKIFNNLSDDGYANQTIKHVEVVIGGMLTQAHKNKIIPENPMAYITVPKGKPRVRRNALTKSEQDLLLEYVKKRSPSFYTIYALALCTGMRKGELFGLKWEDVDFKNRVIHVTASLSWVKGSPVRGTPKTKTSFRDIPMNDNAYKILKQQRLEQAESRIKNGVRWNPLPGLENLVFTSITGLPRSAGSLDTARDRCLDGIRKDGKEICKFTFHSLRHTFATRAIEGGMNPQTLKSIMGHTSLSMTMDLYSHVMEDTKAKEMNQINRMFS